MAVVPGQNLDDLSRMAEEFTRARGHDLGKWEAPPGEQTIARRAVCRRCGRIAYVRSERGLAGTGGSALTEACSRERRQAG